MIFMDRLAQAIRLRKAGQRRRSLKLFLELSRRYPRNPTINYQCAWAHDILGREREAIPFYVRAIKDGLRKRDLEGALLGLGSSYRCLGDYRKAEKTLRLGVKRFPRSRPMQIFLAMALFNTNQHGQAMKLLLRNLAETSADGQIIAYKTAISFYADKLGKVWR
jgi:tetratricopeptide (TPR) repeat protein